MFSSNTAAYGETRSQKLQSQILTPYDHVYGEHLNNLSSFPYIFLTTNSLMTGDILSSLNTELEY